MNKTRIKLRRKRFEFISKYQRKLALTSSTIINGATIQVIRKE
ncbi:hypothetical protein [Leptospira limi]|nr:hypothetical protein [Leptospira limi]